MLRPLSLWHDLHDPAMDPWRLQAADVPQRKSLGSEIIFLIEGHDVSVSCGCATTAASQVSSSAMESSSVHLYPLKTLPLPFSRHRSDVPHQASATATALIKMRIGLTTSEGLKHTTHQSIDDEFLEQRNCKFPTSTLLPFRCFV
jgi:hypothetical protein